MRIEYGGYKFVRPGEPDYAEFQELKQALVNNSKFKFGPRLSFFKEFSKYFILWLICLGLGSLSFLLEWLSAPDWICGILLLPLFFAFISLFFFGLSAFSFIDNKMMVRSYFGDLKRHIRKSKDHEEFVQIRKKSGYC